VNPSSSCGGLSFDEKDAKKFLKILANI
jgi:hypothetical protein